MIPRRVAVLGPAINWSARFANESWLPNSLRCLPLRVLALVVRVIL